MFSPTDVILALFAHPDDAELACFGTLARLRSAGCGIYSHTVTVGEATSNGSCAVNGLRRARESVAAAELVDGVASWDSLPDGRVTSSAPTVDAIQRRVRSLAPTVVITHHPDDPGHQDHRTVGRAAVQVALRADGVRCVLLAEPPTPAREFTPSLLVDVTDYYDVKRRAVAAHRSESTKAFLGTDVLDTRARWWALHAGVHALDAGRRFEAFEVRRMILD